MGITAVLAFITLLFAVALIGGIGVIMTSVARGRPVRMGTLLVIVGIIGVIVTATLNSGLHLIQPYEIGVVFRQTGNNDLRTPIQPGLKWVVPFIDQVVVYNAGQQNIDMLGA